MRESNIHDGRFNFDQQLQSPMSPPETVASRNHLFEWDSVTDEHRVRTKPEVKYVSAVRLAHTVAGTHLMLPGAEGVATIAQSRDPADSDLHLASAQDQVRKSYVGFPCAGSPHAHADLGNSGVPLRTLHWQVQH